MEANKRVTDVTSAFINPTSKDKPEADTEVVDHITNMDLKSLCIRNLNKIMAGQLNINSIGNKFDFLAHQVKENIGMLMISETKFDKSFPAGQSLIDGLVFPSVLTEMEIEVIF